VYPYHRYRNIPRRIPIRSAKDGIMKEETIKYQQPVEQPLSEDNGPTRSDDAITVKEAVNDKDTTSTDQIDWQAQALRLQSDMENFRKRQTRRADEAIAAERERLLRRILPVVDNFERALKHDSPGDEGLRQGVELIYRELVRLLEAEGVTRLETVGQPFRPSLHEAIATTPAEVESDTIVEEIEAGYELDGKLLRPARVVVAT
jgi:molecular chaperone GrpE